MPYVLHIGQKFEMQYLLKLDIFVLVIFDQRNMASSYYQKQSFTDVLPNRCWKFCKFYRKAVVLKSHFNIVEGLKASNFIKKKLQHICFPVKFAKLLRVVSLQKTSLLLHCDGKLIAQDQNHYSL